MGPGSATTLEHRPAATHGSVINTPNDEAGSAKVTSLTILPDNERILVKPGETILQALYAAGYAYRVGCRRGGCAICKVDIKSGSVTYDHPVSESVLTEEELSKGTCLTCRAVPDGDVTIQMRDETLQLTSSILRRLRAV